AVEASSPHIANMNHRLTVSLPSEPIRIRGDLTRLAQAVSNLLNNAAKFTDSGGSINLSVEHNEQQAVIRVQDSGIGISAEQLPLIFEMFTQVDTSLQRTQSGLGIGLMVVKSLVEMHDGTIEAHSPGLGQGCEFIMRLPVCDDLPAASSEEISDKDAQPARTRRILVVDDSVDSATSLATFLQLMGNETHTAFDGLEALQVADAVQPDVVLLDIGMPRLNGYETARRIRARPWADQVVLVAVTGFGQEEDRQKARDAGFDHHMVKPIDASSLLETLDNLPVHAEHD
ncbi:MAG TPA: ATP-binding protein, partial [Burkholderiaceae bacterium]|nr:ATP-binding protein [Burkholderiaceae bacterium]